MKEDKYTDIICKRFCTFYKGPKEELRCGTYLYLKEHYSPRDLTASTMDMNVSPDFSEDERIHELICKRCDFLVDGCDYREGAPSPPCGGYLIVEHLIKRGLMGNSG